jgi:hypothetical protein
VVVAEAALVPSGNDIDHGAPDLASLHAFPWFPAFHHRTPEIDFDREQD